MVAGLVGAVQCGPSQPANGADQRRVPIADGGAPPAPAQTATEAAPAPADGALVTDDGKTTRPTHKLTTAEARKYMLALINRDRRSEKLGPVVLDTGPPTASGQSHADDMAHLGYLGHWGSDGSVPEERLTRAGGADMVLENASCFTDEKTRTLDPSPQIDPAEVERAESMFFNEKPPNDGHRKNILKPAHTRVGIGVAQPKDTATEIAVPCFSQEFLDTYGTYEPLPTRAKVGTKIKVKGRATPSATAVGITRIDTPKPLSTHDLNQRRSYPVPAPFALYWPKGFVTEIPLVVTGDAFEIEVPLANHEKAPGLYEVSVWSKLPGNESHTMISLRTILVE